MVSPINQNVSAVQLFSAASAFKSSINSPVKPVTKIPDVSDGTEINDFILNSKDIAEIQKYAKMAGENNLNIDDIKYGLSYGRSVIIEYSA